MLAGDVATATMPAVGSAHANAVALETSRSDVAASSTAIAFVDAELKDLDALLDALPPSCELVLLQSGKDVIQQITDAFASRSNVQAIHILSHGDAGRISVGDQIIDSETLTHRRSEILSWRGALHHQADILLYGCETGRSTRGLQFVTLLSQLTGADVAASTDKTGAAHYGGDWDLERSLGDIETSVVLDPVRRRELKLTLPIEIRAAGSTGEESMELQINGQVVATFDNVGGDANAGVFESFNYDADGVDPSLVRIAFTNDLYQPDQGIDRNLRVDSITIDGTIYQTEDTSVYSTGTWETGRRDRARLSRK